ncbi:MAG: hypothetical protein ACPGQL_09830 [Thermoplasmatota archaeon]
MADERPPQTWQRAQTRPPPQPETGASPPTAPTADAAPSGERAQWKPVIRLGSMASGVVGGLGFLVLLQQYGKVLVTTGSLLAAAGLGLIGAVLLSWAAYALGVSRYNRRLEGSRTPLRPPAVWLVLLAGAVLLSASGDGRAAMEGPCEGEMAGQDVSVVKVITVQEDQDVPYRFTAPSGVTSSRVEMEYGPFSQVIVEDTHSGSTRAVEGTAPVSDFAWMGVGLYQVSGEVGLENGESCQALLRVLVEGNPLTTVAGLAAAAATTGGVGGVALSFFSTVASVKP